jgi:hypothetical protein
MRKPTLLLAFLGLALSVVSGCANNPGSPSPEIEPSYMSNDCSDQEHYDSKSCIPAPAPPPPSILDGD